MPRYCHVLGPPPQRGISVTICRKSWLRGLLINVRDILEPVLPFSGKQVQRYEATWPRLTSWPVTELELSKSSPVTPRFLLIPVGCCLQITDEVKGEANGFVLGKVLGGCLCTRGSGFFSFIPICTETCWLPWKLFRACQARVCLPSWSLCWSTLPLISNSLSIFLGHWAHYLTFIYTYLHFPSSKPTHNT